MKGIRSGGLIAAVAVGVMFAGLAPGVSAAGTTKYHPRGWHSQVEYGPGLCVPAINCPKVTNSRRSGHLMTKLNSLTGVAAQSRGIWQSTPFRYRGAKGKRPNRLTLKLLRRSEVAALLDVVGNSANYTVEIIKQGNGVAVAPIDHRRVRQTKNWTRVSVRLRPGALQIGRRYYVRVTSEFKTGVDVFPRAAMDYTRILLRASRKGRRGHTAVLHHNRLRIRVGCPTKYRPGKCKVKTVGVVHRRGPAVTRRGSARVRAGHHRYVTMRVRHHYRHWVQTHKRILVRERLRVHHHTHRVYRLYRIVRR
jgi:hypothetical protein